jgi:AmiR/NasT family two-component response regulator
VNEISTNLRNALVLVAEDEPFIALDLAMAIEDAGGRVVGPTATVAEGLTLIADIRLDGAILDVNLADRDVEPLASHLLDSGVAVVVQTGVGLPQTLEARYPSLSVNLKPCMAAALVTQLAELLSKRPIPRDEA